MCCCTQTRQKYWIFGCSVFILLIALILAILWPTLAWSIIRTKLVLSEGSLNYDNWIETPIPMYLEITLFNWTNSDEMHNKSVKPMFVEMGPYVFLEKHKRVKLEWLDDANTVSFNQTRTWHFVPEESKGTLDDMVTNLNVMTATTAYMVRNQNRLVKMITNYIVNTKGEGKAVVTKKARELIFDGYDDPLLDFIKSTNSTAIRIPFDKFGWFVERNGSSAYDGRFNMNTGKDNLAKLGILNTWNNESKVSYYHDHCGMINGTTGELWPPIAVPENPVSMFVTDFCRSFSLEYEKDVEMFGVPGARWIGKYSVFDNGMNYEPNYCFCTNDPAHCPDMPSGVLNVSDCRYGAPAFVSFPHFYLADAWYTDQIDGLNPRKALHEFSLSMNPTTGIPLEVNGRLQVNILMEPDNEIKIFKDVRKAMIPMFWFRQRVAITEELAEDAKMALMLPLIGGWVAIGIAVLGLILSAVGVYLSCCRKQNAHEQFINDESAEEPETDRPAATN